jgi:hypothetical protein
VSIVGSDGQTRQASTSPKGVFEAELTRGTYHVTGRSPAINSGKSDCLPASTVVIARDRTTRVDVICDIV